MDLLELALLEQGKIIVGLKKEREAVAAKLNELAVTVDENNQRLWSNQHMLDGELKKILHVLDPEQFPLPTEEKEEINAESSPRH